MAKLFWFILAVEGIINIDLYRIGANDTDLALTSAEPEVSLTDLRNMSQELLHQEKVLMLGALSTLLSSCFWQISAIYLSLPVSGSHSIVSGLIGNIMVSIIIIISFYFSGFTLVAHGSDGVNWSKTGVIFLGWILSPLLSLLLTAIIYAPLYYLVIRSNNPFSLSSKIFYSFIIGLTFSINCGTVLTTGDYFYKVFGVSTAWTGGRGLFYLVSLWLGGMIAVMVYLLVLPCIISSHGDFALRCECCPSPNNDRNKVNPEISVIDTEALEQQTAAHNNFITPVMSKNLHNPDHDHWVRRPPQEDGVDQDNRSRSVSVPGTPGGVLNVPPLSNITKSVPTTPQMSRMYGGNDGVEEEITLPVENLEQKKDVYIFNNQTDITNRPKSVLENVKKAYDPKTIAQAAQKVYAEKKLLHCRI